MEKRVWGLVGDGDQQAYAELYVFYYKQLFNYGRKFTTDMALLEDAVQEALVSVWTGRERLERVEKPHTYLFNSFRYILFKKIRQASKIWTLAEPAEGEPEFGVEHILISRDMETSRRQQLEKALQGLTSRQREAIFLRFYQGLSYDEVAEVLGISVKATYKIMSRALLQLKEALSLPILTLLLLLRDLA